MLEDNQGRPIITKDGVTVAKSITLRKKLPGIGAGIPGCDLRNIKCSGWVCCNGQDAGNV